MPEYARVTSVGNITNVNIAEGDKGSEFDPHGADRDDQCGARECDSCLVWPGSAQGLAPYDVEAHPRALLELDAYLPIHSHPQGTWSAGSTSRAR